MFYRTGRLLLLTLGLSVLAACADGPGGAPRTGQILKGADRPDATFAVYPVTRESLPALKSWPTRPDAVSGGWLERVRGPSSQVIEAGDTLSLSIWDNSETSLLTQTGDKVVDLQGIQVSPQGDVFLPYVDRVYIGGMTPDGARSAVQERFSAVIPSAQVQLKHTPGRKSTVDLVSGVRTPGNYPLPDRDYTVLSLIAQGGGIDNSLSNPQVRLMRGGKLYGIAVEKLLKNPGLDTTLRGGDRVYLESDSRYFLALGATRNEAQIKFPHDRVTALDAASLAGGLNDSRANPKGVLVLREYAPTALRSDGSGPEKDRTIFAIDLTSADGLFSAGDFQIQDRDVVLVTESRIVGANTVIALFYQALGIPLRVDTLSE